MVEGSREDRKRERGARERRGWEWEVGVGGRGRGRSAVTNDINFLNKLIVQVQER